MDGHRKTDRQIDKQTERQADRQINQQTDGRTDGLKGEKGSVFLNSIIADWPSLWYVEATVNTLPYSLSD